MTVSSLVPVNNHTGNGSTCQFDFDFLIEDEKELVVTLINKKENTEEQLIFGVDYSINEIGVKNGSFIIYPLEEISSHTVLSPDEVISLSLNLPVKQESEFENSATLKLDVLEWTFDYIIRLIQILNRKIERSLKVKEGVDVTPDSLISELNQAQINSKTYAKVADEKAQIATEQANIASQKVEEVMDACEKAVEDISDTSSTVISTIEATQSNVVNEIQSLGIFMENGRLFYRNEEGIQREFGGGGLPTGMIFPSLVPLTEDYIHLLDGSILTIGGIYDDFITKYIIPLTTSNPECFITEEEWQTRVSQYSVCGKFVYTEGVGVRLPKITGFVEGTIDSSSLGTIIEAGLPNITGQINLGDNRDSSGTIATGAFSRTSSTVSNSGFTATTKSYKVNFNASKSNSIYGKSTTVQPQSVKVFYYIVLGTVTKTDIEVDMDNIVTDLNGKANIYQLDGEVICKNTTLLDLSKPAVGNYQIDLSNILPNDGANYDLNLYVYSDTSNDTSANNRNFNIFCSENDRTNTTNYVLSYAQDGTNQSIGSMQHIPLLYGTRTLYIKLTGTSSAIFNTLQVKLYSYRKRGR